jgi:hypothetical protein
VIAAAKRYIPVIKKISTFRDGTKLYKRFNFDHEKKSAVRLLEKLKEQKKSKKRTSHTPVSKPGAYGRN